MVVDGLFIQKNGVGAAIGMETYSSELHMKSTR